MWRGVLTYDTLFKVILRRGRYMMAKRLETAFRFSEDMKSGGVAPDVVLYDTMINGMLEEMKSCNVKPNAITDTALLPSLCDVGKVAEAPKVLREMVERYIAPKDNSIFMKLLTAQCKSGDLNAAADVLNAMIRLSIPTQAGRSSVLIANFCKQGNPDSAFDIIKIMGRRGVPREADAYTYLIESYLRKGEPVDARTAMDSMLEDGPRFLTMEILEALLMRGHVEEALGLIDLLTQSACVPTFDSLLYVLFEKGKTICAKLLDYYLERDCIVEFSSYEKVLDDW
ncbi:pentatricopeptide repeat-containing protein [Citrus sinensis]|nr:pentatricopeptide repeat-containing protein [Citrus sinensis]